MHIRSFVFGFILES